MSQPEPVIDQDREIIININIFWKLQGMSDLMQLTQEQVLEKALSLLLKEYIIETEQKEITRLQNEIMGINES